MYVKENTDRKEIYHPLPPLSPQIRVKSKLKTSPNVQLSNTLGQDAYCCVFTVDFERVEQVPSLLQLYCQLRKRDSALHFFL